MLRALALAGGLVILPALASAQQPCTTADARQVVNLIYSNVLERAADRGSDTHVRRLRNGDATVRQLVSEIVHSSEYREQFLSGDAEANVRTLYRHILGREPDPTGLKAHTQAVQGGNLGAVIDLMLNSEEYQKKYAENGVPGAPGVRYCRSERGLARTGGATDDMRFREMDTNRDGVITAREWQGSRQAFLNNDWNDDNILSGDEVQPDNPRQGARREDREFNTQTPREFSSWSEAGFDNIDHNRDGRISELEWNYGYEAFNRVDRNRDGIVTRAEFRTAETTDRNDRFQALDADRDGHVELREWQGTAAAFDALDRDNDNVLSRNEFR